MNERSVSRLKSSWSWKTSIAVEAGVDDDGAPLRATCGAAPTRCGRPGVGDVVGFVGCAQAVSATAKKTWAARVRQAILRRALARSLPAVAYHRRREPFPLLSPARSCRVATRHALRDGFRGSVH